jgi:uncharacterized protein YxjI
MEQERLIKLKSICEKILKMDSVGEILKLVNENLNELDYRFELKNRNNNSLESIKNAAEKTIIWADERMITMGENNGNN